MTEDSPFTKHVIRSRVETDGFGSWLLNRKHADGGWEHTFWCRVTAADRLLTVTGDFPPTVFAYGPANPLACVRWMGTQNGTNMYVTEKARTGTGDDRITEYDTELAFKHLRELIEEADPEDDGGQYIAALVAGLEVIPSRDGRIGVHEICDVVASESGMGGDIWESIGHVGRRPAASVELAIQALNRLVELLDAEENVADEMTAMEVE